MPLDDGRNSILYYVGTWSISFGSDYDIIHAVLHHLLVLALN